MHSKDVIKKEHPVRSRNSNSNSKIILPTFLNIENLEKDNRNLHKNIFLLCRSFKN